MTQRWRFVLIVFGALLSARAAAFQPRTGQWWNPNESGRGFNIDIQNGVMVMTMYTYDASGNAQWYLAAGPMTNGQRTFSATMDRYVGGQCVMCSYQPAVLVGNDGLVTVNFSDEMHATIAFPGGHVSSITPFDFAFGPLPAGLLGEWVFVYDIGSITFADRYDYSTTAPGTATGTGLAFDPTRGGACEYQDSGAAAGSILCVQVNSAGAVLNSYEFKYGLDETFSGVWIAPITFDEYAMKGFRVVSPAGYSKRSLARGTIVVDEAIATAKLARVGATPGAPSSPALIAELKALAQRLR